MRVGTGSIKQGSVKSSRKMYFKAKTEDGWSVQGWHVLRLEAEGVGPGMMSLGHRDIWKATGDGKDGARVAG